LPPVQELHVVASAAERGRGLSVHNRNTPAMLSASLDPMTTVIDNTHYAAAGGWRRVG
jgi:hypothetical protein